jgi:hypothetical protein
VQHKLPRLAFSTQINYFSIYLLPQVQLCLYYLPLSLFPMAVALINIPLSAITRTYTSLNNIHCILEIWKQYFAWRISHSCKRLSCSETDHNVCLYIKLETTWHNWQNNTFRSLMECITWIGHASVMPINNSIPILTESHTNIAFRFWGIMFLLYLPQK